MATAKSFHDYVMDCLAPVGVFHTRKMMGEYCLYHRGKTIGLLCDNMLLLKPTAGLLTLLPDAERIYPYEGSKTKMVVLEALENTDLLQAAIRCVYEELPEPEEKGKAKMSKYEPLWQWIAKNGTDYFTLTYGEIAEIAGIPLDHSFLKFKKELSEYGYQVGKISMKAETVAFEKIKKAE